VVGLRLIQSAASATHAQGIIRLALLIVPVSKARIVARFAEWDIPMSSAWIISSFSCVLGCHSCTAVRRRMLLRFVAGY
jgi:hypothetical protein